LTAVSADPAQLEVVSPPPDSIWGSDGRGFLIDLAITSRRGALLAVSSRPVIASSLLHAGHNDALPGLVVLLSTTTIGAGSRQNLAGLFQIAAAGQLKDGSVQIRTAWLAAEPAFGADVDTELRAYLVDGIAPDVVPSDAGRLTAVSNIAMVRFHIGGASGLAPSTTPHAAASAPASAGSAVRQMPQISQTASPAAPTAPPAARPSADPTGGLPASITPRAGTVVPPEQTVIVTLPPRPGLPQATPSAPPPPPSPPPRLSPSATVPATPVP